MHSRIALFFYTMAIKLQGLSKERLSGLRNEIVMSQKLVKSRLQPIMRESLERYLGRFIPKFGADWDILLNEVYPVVQSNLPSIFFRNPKAFLKPRNKTFIAKRRNVKTGKMEEEILDSSKSARTQEDILNYIISQIGYKKETRKVLLDALLYPFGVMWHGYKGDFGMTDEDSFRIQNDRIFVKRISPLRFLKDPSVSYSELEEAQWVGRSIDVRFTDLEADKQLNFKDKEIKSFLGFGDQVFDLATFGAQGMETSMIGGGSLNSPLSEFADNEFKRSKASKFVRVHEIYMRPNKEERNKGDKGWVILLADGQKEPLRINKLTLKAEGFPAQLLEFNPVNDREFGLSDVETYSSIADQKNVIINLQIRNAQENTKVWVGISKDGANEEDIQKVQQGENTIILFDEGKPGDRMFVASPGAQASSELYIIDQRIQKNLEDKSGVTDLKRGNLQSGEESATSVKIRAAGGNARPAYRQDVMKDFLEASFLYINQLNKQFMTIKAAVRVIGSLDLEWSDNPTKEEIQADVDIEIDVISMLSENPEKEITEMREAIGMIIQAISDPAIRQKIQSEGKTFNLSPLIEQMLRRLQIMNPDVFRNIDKEGSEGFVSAQQLREAQENIIAFVQGQQFPHEPKEEDDHRAKLQTYASAAALLQLGNKVTDALEQLIVIHQEFIASAESKQATPGVKLPGPSIARV